MRMISIRGSIIGMLAAAILFSINCTSKFVSGPLGRLPDVEYESKGYRVFSGVISLFGAHGALEYVLLELKGHADGQFRLDIPIAEKYGLVGPSTASYGYGGSQVVSRDMTGGEYVGRRVKLLCMPCEGYFQVVSLDWQ